ncbi:Sporulation initiation inhibitor protein Soj [bacterium HR19]|nr:Sporulation initiation inhibitor protein Soj [bacterium HR19]
MKVIAIFSEKGGVGKTTIATNLSLYLAKKEYKVLIIDMDPQGHVHKVLGSEKKSGRVLELLTKDKNPYDFISKTRIENLSIIPSDWSLADFTITVAKDPQRHIKLRNTIQKIKNDFDIIIIDSPPSLELITINILLASEGVIIPVLLSYLGLVGAASTLKIISQTKKVFKYSPAIIAFVPNMYEETPQSKELLEKLKSKLGKLVSKTVIRKDPQIDRAQSYSASVFDLEQDSVAKRDFENLADEIILKIGI